MDLVPLISEELNMKEVLFVDDLHEYMNISLKPNFKEVGKVLGPLMKEFQSKLESLTDQEINTLQSGKNITMILGGEEQEITPAMVDIRISSKEGFNVGMENNNFMIIDTTLTDELLLEGLAREIVSKVQQFRKNSNFEVTDRITLSYKGDEDIQKCMKEFQEFIQNETLSVAIVESDQANLEADINGHLTYFTVEKEK